MGSDYKSVSQTLLSKRKYEEEPSDSKDDILAFGYQVKLYNDQAMALRVEQGKYMIPLRSDDSNKVIMSRYDVRHLLQDEKQFIVTEKAILDSAFDKERYEDLECFQEEKHEENEEEEEMHSVNNNKKQKVVLKEQDESSVQQSIIATTFKTPKNMKVPSSKEQVEIIQSTVKIVLGAKHANLAEIHIQARQANNPLYSFLNRKDQLYSFYKHILWLSSSGLGGYGDSDSDDDSSSSSLVDMPDDIKQIILKTAQFVAKSNNSALEQHIRSKRMGDPKFDFLNPQNTRYYAYYRSQVECFNSKKSQ
ncbi:hypothetical protein K501DRAFT_328670 [Backusella circina FSU 941]|nr:hypothetical protein K501DRAFT_328670 [Backusella circina FSU 941]